MVASPVLILWASLGAGGAQLRPRALPEADAVVFVPRLDRLEQALPFFAAVGAHSSLLRPTGWRTWSHPILNFDPADAQSLAVAGVAPRGPLTHSRRDALEVSCLELADPRRYVDACEAALARAGTLFRRVEGTGVSLVGARDALGRVLGAYAIRGTESCAIAGGSGLGVEKALPLLLAALAQPFALPPALGNEPPVVSFLRPRGVPSGLVALSPQGLTLTASARLSNLPSSSFAIAGASPFATLRPAGLATLRLRLRKEAMPAAIAALEARLPPGVSLGTTGAALARVLTGNVALFAHAVRVDSGLRTPEARFFALRFAALAETSEPAQVAQVLGQLDRRSLRRRGGSVELGLSGSTLWLANEPTARAAALAALGPPSGVQGHAVELSANPSAVARAMAQVPLFEAVQSPELAVLLAIATELGPALLHSASVTGWADPGPRSTARAQLTWVVEPPEPPEPAGDLAPASRREPQ